MLTKVFYLLALSDAVDMCATFAKTSCVDPYTSCLSTRWWFHEVSCLVCCGWLLASEIIHLVRGWSFEII